MIYINQYRVQKSNAQQRGIEWQFTYDEWINWWGDDIVCRGKRTGQLVMARLGDIGPYSPDNCVKKTCNENVKEGLKQRNNQDPAGRLSQSHIEKIRSAPKAYKPIMTPYGSFKSITEASRHPQLNLKRIYTGLKKFPENYFYIGINT